ncbi:hypothetical protein BCV71DRAFT_154103, partial [Rhizopus microsporus]
NCSSCHAPLPVDSAYRTCQTCREQVAATRRRREDLELNLLRPFLLPISRLRPLNLGRMDKECLHCHALYWIDERQEISSMRNPTWESCCKQGSVYLQLSPDPPEYLKNLLASTDVQGRHFKDNLRQYSAAFAFTSLRCDIVSAEERNASSSNNNNNNNRKGGLNAFQIHDVLCYRQGSLFSAEVNASLYAQLYIYDPSYVAQRRSERNENLDNGNIE